MVQCPICVDHLVLRALLSTGPQTERPGGAYTFPGWPQPGTTFVGRILIRGRSGQDWLPQMSRFFEWSGPLISTLPQDLSGFQGNGNAAMARYGARRIVGRRAGRGDKCDRKSLRTMDITAATGFERLPGERQRRYGAVWRAPYSRPPGGSRAPVRDKRSLEPRLPIGARAPSPAVRDRRR